MKNNIDQESIYGNIDGICGCILTGWFYIQNIDYNKELTLYVNGKHAQTTNANQPRTDVEKALGFGGYSGFFFDLSDLELATASQISIEHKESGHDFFGVSMMFCPQVAQYRKDIQELFFPEFYRNKYGMEKLSNDAAFIEFISAGIYEDRDPSPWFNNEYVRKNYGEYIAEESLPIVEYLKGEESFNYKPSELFDPQYYQSVYTDLANVNRLLGHYTIYGRSEGRQGIGRAVPDHIKQEVKQYLEIEPALVSVADNLDQIVRYPFITGSTYVPRLTKKKYANTIKVIICVPFISVGGADLISTHVLRAYQQRYGIDSVLLVVTNKSYIEIEAWVDPDTQLLCLDQECEYLSADDKVDTLHRVIALLAPEKIVNINSNECWELYKKNGVQLSTELDLYAYLFCFDYDSESRRVGYIPEYIPDLTSILKSVFCDNRNVIDEMKEIYGFSESDLAIFHTVYIPINEEMTVRSTEAGKRASSILWAGRLARQKRPDLLVEIALAMPHQLFTVYGPEGDSPVSNDIVNGKYANIHYAGVYTDITELALEEYKLILNTSQWEGLPTLLIQMSAAGMPIVTSSVGGIHELITDETGWIVEDQTNVQEYITTINKAIIQKESTVNRLEKGLTHCRSVHSWSNFKSRLEEASAFSEFISGNDKNVVYLDRRGKGSRPPVNAGSDFDQATVDTLEMFKRSIPYKSLRLVGKDGQIVPIQGGSDADSLFWGTTN